MSTVQIAGLVAAWNEGLSLKITEADIKNPTEHFFRKVLLAILRQLYIDTTCYDSMDSETSNRLRLLRNRLVATVNHFYKIACPGVKQEFCYMDLLQPTSKKVFFTLQYLQNYAMFVRQTYESTICELKSQVTERNQLQMYKNNLRKENEEAKIAEENNVKAIKELDAAIPQKKSKIEELLGKEKAIKNEIVKLEEEFERAEMKLMELKAAHEALQSDFVSEEEIESILDQKALVAKQLDEKEQIALANRQKLQENATRIDKTLATTVKMENLVTANNLDSNLMKSKKEKIMQLENGVASLKAKIASLQMAAESYTKSLEAKKKTLKEISMKRDEIKKNYAMKNAEQRKILKQKKSQVKKSQKEASKLAAEKQKHEDEQALVIKIASTAIKQITRKFAVNKDDKENFVGA